MAMSWITRIQQQILIQTGDGIRYEPQWLNASYDQQYNLNIFNYIDVPGSQINREEPQSRRFALDIFFIGENHIEIGEQFRLSAADRRPWTITHPFYDEIVVHPVRLRFDHTQYNVTQITGQIVETIPDRFPRETADREALLVLQKEQLDVVAATAFGEQTSQITAAETNIISESVDELEANGNQVLDAVNQVEFRNTVLNAQREITNIATRPIETLRAIQSTINFPANVVAGVRARVDNLIEAFNRVVVSLENITGLSRNRKVYGETAGASIISALIPAATTNRDLQTRAEVQGILDDILSTYGRYLAVLDGFQTDSQTQLDSYAPNSQTQNALSEFMYFALSALIDISLESQQEFIIVNESASNAIVLAHRVYGLDENDNNLSRFIETNNIGINEILEIPKDREILYYV